MIIFNRQMWGADTCPPARGASCRFNDLHDELINVARGNSPVLHDILEHDHSMYSEIKAYINQIKYDDHTFIVHIFIPVHILQKFLQDAQNWRYRHLIGHAFAIQLITTDYLLGG